MQATKENAKSSSGKKDKIGLKKCTTPKFRVSFPKVFKAESYEGAPAKFSIVMLFDKESADLTPLKKAVHAAAVEKWGADKTKWPKNLRMPFRDGDEKADLQGYDNCTFVSASSKLKPGIVDGKLQPLTEETEFYAGCYARATLIAFAYDKAGNRGVSFSLQNLQKMSDGEAFSGRRRAEDEFESFDDGSESEENYESESDEYSFD